MHGHTNPEKNEFTTINIITTIFTTVITNITSTNTTAATGEDGVTDWCRSASDREISEKCWSIPRV